MRFFLFFMLISFNVFAKTYVLRDGSVMETSKAGWPASTIAERTFPQMPHPKEGFMQQERWVLVYFDGKYEIRKWGFILFNGEYAASHHVKVTVFSSYLAAEVAFEASVKSYVGDSSIEVDNAYVNHDPDIVCCVRYFPLKGDHKAFVRRWLLLYKKSNGKCTLYKGYWNHITHQFQEESHDQFTHYQDAYAVFSAQH